MKRILKRILKRIVYEILERRGFKAYMANHYSQLIVTDLFETKAALKDIIWAYRKGFLSSRINNYKLTKDNYREYLSDYDYYRMFPLNGREQMWINDKLTTKYVLAPFDEFLPEYYFLLDAGKVVPLHNVKPGTYSLENVLEILKDKRKLAFKKEAASGGDGFYKVEYDDKIQVNGEDYSESEFMEMLSQLKDYLVMEYITAHSDIKKYYDGASGVLRIMVINEDEPKIVNAYIRVGTSVSGAIDAYTGSVSAVVDVESGEYSEAWMHDGVNFIRLENHPDSDIPFQGTIPKWEFVKEKILDMSKYLYKLKYLGFDVCVTDDGFKIYEINSHQGIELYQLSYPLLKNNPAADFFKTHIK